MGQCLEESAVQPLYNSTSAVVHPPNFKKIDMRLKNLFMKLFIRLIFFLNLIKLY